MRSFRQTVLTKSSREKLLRWVSLALMLAIAALYFSLPAFAQTKYVITDGDNVIVCMSTSTDPQVVIEEAGLKLGESDTYTTQKQDGVSQIKINRVQMVSVYEGGQMSVVGSYGGTVADILDALDLTLSPNDVLSCSLDTETYDGMDIRIVHTETDTITYEESLPFETKRYESGALAPGEEVTLVEGADGLCRYTAEVIYEDGEEVSRNILSQHILSNPTDAIILRGVDRSVKEQEFSDQPNYFPASTTRPWEESGSSQPAAGESPVIPGTDQTYSTLLYCSATAYTCQDKHGVTTPGTTFSGTPARVGAIAVDPNVIPLGSKLYIVSADGEYLYGYCVAEDTGGAIKGNTVDLYYNTYDECIQFGRRDVLVYVIE